MIDTSNGKDARSVIEEMMDKYEDGIKDVTDMFDEAMEDILAVYLLPKKYWKRFRSTNMIEKPTKTPLEEKKWFAYSQITVQSCIW